MILLLTVLSLCFVLGVVFVSQKSSPPTVHHNEEEHVLARSLLPSSREGAYYFVIVGFTIFLTYTQSGHSDYQEALTTLNRYFGLFALVLLVLTLTPGLIRVYFPLFYFNKFLLTARRSLGLTTFYFAFIHGLLSLYLYFNLSPFTLFTFKFSYKIAAIFGIASLLLLGLMAFFDIPFLLRKFGFKVWKSVHRTIYLAAILAIFHVFIRGTDFQNKMSLFPLTAAFALFIFFALEIFATVIELRKNDKKRPKSLTYFYYFCLAIFLAIGIFLILDY